MDGIFGVGLPEMLIIALVLFIVGGPKNTVKWAHELGVWARKARESWSKVVAEMEQELGPDGKEVFDTARELGKGAREMRHMNPLKNAVNETLRLTEKSIDADEVEAPPQVKTPVLTSSATSPVSTAPAAPKNGTSSNGASESTENKYPAWLPPDTTE